MTVTLGVHHLSKHCSSDVHVENSSACSYHFLNFIIFISRLVGLESENKPSEFLYYCFRKRLTGDIISFIRIIFST